MKKRIAYLLKKVKKQLLYACLLQYLFIPNLQANNSRNVIELNHPIKITTKWTTAFMIPIDGTVVQQFSLKTN